MHMAQIKNIPLGFLSGCHWAETCPDEMSWAALVEPRGAVPCADRHPPPWIEQIGDDGCPWVVVVVVVVVVPCLRTPPLFPSFFPRHDGLFQAPTYRRLSQVAWMGSDIHIPIEIASHCIT
jgi:hypothetical protein